MIDVVATPRPDLWDYPSHITNGFFQVSEFFPFALSLSKGERIGEAWS